MAKNACKNQKGVTLIEVLISVALLGIITTVFIQILNSSILLRSKSDLQSEASAIAMSQIEALKQSDRMPDMSHLVTNTTINGFDVVMTLTDVTSTLTLPGNSLGQANTSAYNAAPLSITIGNALTVVNSNLDKGQFTLPAVTNKTLRLNITEVPNVAGRVNYQLTYPTDLGTGLINLGEYTRLSTGQRLIKVARQPSLAGSVTILVNDSTREPLQFGIFEDVNRQIAVSPVGLNTTLTVAQNLSDQRDPETLTQHYFEVLVTVNRQGQNYARLLSTWAVKGE